MADILMCESTTCPLAPECYRIQAPADEHQWVSKLEPVIDGEGNASCIEFYPIEGMLAVGKVKKRKWNDD